MTSNSNARITVPKPLCCLPGRIVRLHSYLSETDLIYLPPLTEALILRKTESDNALRSMSGMEKRLTDDLRRVQTSLNVFNTRLGFIEARVSTCQAGTDTLAAETNDLSLAVSDILQELPNLRELLSETLLDIFNFSITVKATGQSLHTHSLEEELHDAFEVIQNKFAELPVCTRNS